MIEKPIDKIYVAVLFLYKLMNTAANILFKPKSNIKARWDLVYEWSESFAIIGAIIIILILIIFGAYIIKEFWNRFMTNTFKVRKINYTESLAIVLLIDILTN